MNILVVEDEDRIADFLIRGLKAEGHSPVHAGDGETALDYLSRLRFDIVLLDVMLPGISGHEVCAKMRFRKDFTPVMMLTALEATDEKIAGLRKGADDYLVKPFDFDELLARIDALRRRADAYSHPNGGEPDSNWPVALDNDGQCLVIDGQTVELSAKEFAIMALLVSNRGRIMSRERILNTVWNTNMDPLTNTVDVHVGRLRKKLGDHGQLIATIRGTGYRYG